MQILGEDADGRIIIHYDSRWQYPECFGYKPSDPQYRMLQELWMNITGKHIGPQPGPQVEKENGQ